MSHVDEGTLHAYLDGALPPAERSQVDVHLAGCPECREWLAEARALIARADGLLALALPAERAAPPLHELRRRPLWRRVGWPIAWAASLTLAVGLGWVLRGRAGAPAALARTERDTLPQTVAMQHYTDEPRRVAQEGAPAVRDRGGREEAQNRTQAARADSATPSAYGLMRMSFTGTPGIVAGSVPSMREAEPR